MRLNSLYLVFFSRVFYEFNYFLFTILETVIYDKKQLFLYFFFLKNEDIHSSSALHSIASGMGMVDVLINGFTFYCDLRFGSIDMDN